MVMNENIYWKRKSTVDGQTWRRISTAQKQMRLPGMNACASARVTVTPREAIDTKKG